MNVKILRKPWKESCCVDDDYHDSFSVAVVKDSVAVVKDDCIVDHMTKDLDSTYVHDFVPKGGCSMYHWA